MASILPQTHGKTLPDAWDFKGRPAERARSGGWGAAAMILGGEAVERLTTLGIAVNLVTYLTGTMHLGNATSATTVTNFLGTSFMLCLLGGFIADSFLGRYLTIAIFATIQATGVTILTISTAVPSLRPPKCSAETGETCVMASGMQLTVLHIALYLTALGTGGLKSSVSGFGSDQFDENDKEERRRMTSFFSWFFLFISIGSLLAVSVLVYIQDNVGRPWGYGICALAIGLGLVLFLAGTRRYRFKKLLGSPLTQIATVFVAAWRKRACELPADSSKLYDLDDLAQGSKKKTKQRLPRSDQFRFMDKAAIKTPETSSEGMVNKWSISTVTDVEEVKCVIRMLPIWATTIMFWTVHAQVVTLSVSQSETMDRHMGSFEIPAASLAVFFVASTIITIPIYDRLVVPIGRKLLKSPQSMTRPLQRIGIGLVLSILGMVVAAIVETKRLHAATSSGIADDPKAVLNLPVFWLVPQFLIVGAGEAFMYIGQLDFFLRECPKGMKTMSTGLFLSTLSVGFFISSLLVTIVEKMTKNSPWIADNLNHGKLYDFYWLLAVMSSVNFMMYSLCAKWYVYKEKRLADQGIEMEESLDIVGH